MYKNDSIYNSNTELNINPNDTNDKNYISNKKDIKYIESNNNTNLKKQLSFNKNHNVTQQRKKNSDISNSLSMIKSNLTHNNDSLIKIETSFFIKGSSFCIFYRKTMCFPARCLVFYHILQKNTIVHARFLPSFRVRFRPSLRSPRYGIHTPVSPGRR